MAASFVADVQGPYVEGHHRVSFPAQWRLYTDTRRIVFGFGGVRSGKTVGAAEKTGSRIAGALFSRLAALTGDRDPDGYLPGEWRPRGREPSDDDDPRLLFWVVAPSYKLAQVAWRKVRSALARLGPLVVKAKQGVMWLRTGIRVEMRTGKDEEQLQAERLAGALVDEVCTLDESAYNQIINRLTDSGGWLIATSSPRPGSWVKRRIWDQHGGVEGGSGGTDGIGVHHWTTEENPHIDPAFIAAAKRDLPERWYRRDFLAGWSTFEGLIYDDYALALDVAVVDVDLDQLRGRQVDAAIDFGLTRPAAMVIAEIDGVAPDGGWGDVVVAEVAMSDAKLPLVLDRLVALLRRLGVAGVTPYVDPAGRARNTQTKRPDLDLVRERLQAAGLLRGGPMYPRTNAERDVLNGIASVQAGFLSSNGARRLFVARHLTEQSRLNSYPPGVAGIHRSLLGYSWQTGKTDVPDKDGVHDHSCDALRYWRVKRRGLASQPQAFEVVPGPAAPSFGRHTDFSGDVWADAGGGWD